MRDEDHPTPAGNRTASGSSYWQGRAEEAHAVAVLMLDPGAKATMLDLAAMYLAMARRAEERRVRFGAHLGVALRSAGAD
jgi:hypothetical protein